MQLNLLADLAIDLNCIKSKSFSNNYSKVNGDINNKIGSEEFINKKRFVTKEKLKMEKKLKIEDNFEIEKKLEIEDLESFE